jgi:hypothetical protein
LKNILEKIFGFVLLGCILFALFILVTAPFKIYQKAVAESWPSRKAIVTKSFASSNRDRKQGVTWRQVLCGTYKDNSESFCVGRFRYGGFRFGTGKRSAVEAAAKYAAGQEVDIYYSPDNPRKTVLEARSPWTEIYILVGLAGFFLLIPVFIWLFRKMHKPGNCQ